MSFNRNPNNEEPSTGETLREAEIDSYLGKRVGIYRLEKRIGKGGMGAVYAAMRDDGEFRQQVAVKLIKRGMDTDFVLNRFRHERQILASLEHPYIARLLDGGTTDEGLPYFVMDFIKGESLIDFADGKNLDLRQRLELFRRVCEAVEFAHQKKIVHRDLKPSNILVTSSGTPKLLDFGIAKLLNPEDALETLLPTQTQMRLMTADYAAPEQIRSEEITPATDVYALGVMLYELVSGARPYKFPSRAAHDVARVVCEENPLPLVIGNAVKTSTLSADAETLERIVFKSLEKNPSDRYQTVKEFSADIERFLKGKTVDAPKRIYRSSPKITLPTASNNPPTGSRSIAVLPLKVLGANDTADTGDQYLSFGLADALIARLSSVKRFVLRPTSSVLRYQSADIDSFTAGKDLGVEFIVEGHLQKFGDRLRVSIQLLDVAGHATVWAERFSEKSADVLELEDAISAKVAESLIPHLTGEERERLEKRGTNSPEAYQAYLRGRYFYNNFNDSDLPRAIESYREAIRLDADYALPYVGIADFFVWSAIFGEIPSSEAYPQAISALHRALEIDSNSGEAYAMLAFTTFLHDWNRDEALRLVRKALELSPNYGFAHECYSNILATADLRDEAIAEIQTAERLDPLSIKPKLMTAWTLYQMRRFPESIEKADEANQMVKDFPQGLVHLGNAMIHTNEAKKAAELLEESYRILNGSALPGYLLCFALVADNRTDEARKILNEIYELAKKRYVKPYFIAMAHHALGENDKAFEYFERSIDERNEWLVWCGTDAKLDALRDDWRFQDLLRRTNSPLAKIVPTKQKSISTSGEKSIAVLPLTMIGAAESDDEFLCIGLADALITRLSNVRRFIVRPTASVLRYERTTFQPQIVSETLGVWFLVTGTIRRVGNRIRVSVQLFDARNDSTVWAQQFDEDFSDILTLEDLISQKIAQSLLPTLTGEEERQLNKRGTNSPEAHEAYLRGRYFANQFSENALVKSLEAFREAVRFDPNYALPHIGIAEFYVWSSIMGAIKTGEAYPTAKEELRLAMAADDSLAEVYTLAALIALLYDWNWAEAERQVLRAIELNPNYYAAHDVYAHILASSGRRERAIAEIKSAEKLDPLSPRAKIMVSCIAYQTRNFDLSTAKAEEALTMDTNSSQALLHLGNALVHGASDSRAVEALTESVNLWSNAGMNSFMLCFALVAQNRLDEAEQVLQKILQLAETGNTKPYFAAMAHTALGNIDEAFAWFEKSIEERDDWILWLGTDIKLDVLKNDARYFELLKRTNNPIIDQIAQ